MRIRIVQSPTAYCFDGIRLDQFRVGMQYEVADTLGSLFISEGWAVSDDSERARFPPSYQRARAFAADRPPRQRRRVN